MTKQMTRLNDCLQNWLAGQNFSKATRVEIVKCCKGRSTEKKYKELSSAALKFLEGLTSEFQTKKLVSTMKKSRVLLTMSIGCR